MIKKILITLLLLPTMVAADEPVNLEIEREPNKLISIGDIYLTKDGWFMQRKLEEEEIIDEIIRQIRRKIPIEYYSYHFTFNDSKIFSIHSNGEVFLKGKKIGNDPILFALFHYIKENTKEKE